MVFVEYLLLCTLEPNGRKGGPPKGEIVRLKAVKAESMQGTRM